MEYKQDEEDDEDDDERIDYPERNDVPTPTAPAQEVSIIIIISTDCVRLSLAGLAVAVIIFFLVVGGLNWCPLLFRGYLYAFSPKKDGRLKKRQARIIGVVNLKP